MLAKTMHGKPLLYFDSAATSLKPQCVVECMSDFYSNNYGTVHRAVYELARRSTECYSQVRETIKKFINAKNSREIIYTRGTTESINLVAYSFGKAFIRPGDEVIVTGLDHQANVDPWTRTGAVVKENRRIKRLIKDGAGWRLDAEHDKTVEPIRARMLIGADGRNSWVASRLRLSGRHRPKRTAIGYQFVLRGVDPGRHRVEIHLFPGGYAGLVHLGDGTANLCMAVMRGVAPRQRAKDLSAFPFLASNPFLRELLSRAELGSPVRSTFPIYFPPRRSYAEAVLLAGDAARVVEPVTGDGIYFALRSGLLAAETTATAFRNGDFSAQGLSGYERSCCSALRYRRLKSGEAVELPLYDFKTHTRMNETRHVEPKPIVIVEGILIFADPRLLEQMDIKVFVDTPDDIRFIRRLRRDLAERGRRLTRSPLLVPRIRPSSPRGCKSSRRRLWRRGSRRAPSITRSMGSLTIRRP